VLIQLRLFDIVHRHQAERKLRLYKSSVSCVRFLLQTTGADQELVVALGENLIVSALDHDLYDQILWYHVGREERRGRLAPEGRRHLEVHIDLDRLHDLVRIDPPVLKEGNPDPLITGEVVEEAHIARSIALEIKIHDIALREHQGFAALVRPSPKIRSRGLVHDGDKAGFCAWMKRGLRSTSWLPASRLPAKSFNL
jgi:hypothetical protein